MIAEAAAVGAAAFLASTVAGVTGFGGAVVLLPVLVWAVGVRDAIVVLTVAQLVGNGSRVFFNRDDVDTAVLERFALGAMPAALLGGLLFAATPSGVLTRLLGGFLLASVAWRHAAPAPPSGRTVQRDRTGLRLPLGNPRQRRSDHGAVLPRLRPPQGRLHRDRGGCTVVMHTTKLVAYGGGGVLASSAVLNGLALAPVMVAGSWTGERILDRSSERAFVLLIDVVLVVRASSCSCGADDCPSAGRDGMHAWSAHGHGGSAHAVFQVFCAVPQM